MFYWWPHPLVHDWDTIPGFSSRSWSRLWLHPTLSWPGWRVWPMQQMSNLHGCPRIRSVHSSRRMGRRAFGSSRKSRPRFFLEMAPATSLGHVLPGGPCDGKLISTTGTVPCCSRSWLQTRHLHCHSELVESALELEDYIQLSVMIQYNY
jgi:hypothetical protein